MIFPYWITIAVFAFRPRRSIYPSRVFCSSQVHAARVYYSLPVVGTSGSRVPANRTSNSCPFQGQPHRSLVKRPRYLNVLRQRPSTIVSLAPQSSIIDEFRINSGELRVYANRVFFKPTSFNRGAIWWRTNSRLIWPQPNGASTSPSPQGCRGFRQFPGISNPGSNSTIQPVAKSRAAC